MQNHFEKEKQKQTKKQKTKAQAWSLVPKVTGDLYLVASIGLMFQWTCVCVIAPIVTHLLQGAPIRDSHNVHQLQCTDY